MVAERLTFAPVVPERLTFAPVVADRLQSHLHNLSALSRSHVAIEMMFSCPKRKALNLVIKLNICMSQDAE